jgi:transposase
MPIKQYTSEQDALDFFAKFHDKMLKKEIAKKLRLGSARFKRLWNKAEEQGLISQPKNVLVPDDKAKGVIKSLYGTMTRDEILARSGIGYRRYYDLLNEMFESGELKPVGKAGCKPKRKKLPVSDSRLLEMWDTMRRSDIVTQLRIGESTLRKRVNEIRANMDVDVEEEVFFEPREQFFLLRESWVPEKFVNHNCRWLAA